MATNGQQPAASEDAPAPTSAFHMESLQHVMKFPVIEAAYNQGAGIYERVKGANSMFNWALSTAEATVQRALITAAPLVEKFEGPIHTVDQTLMMGIQSLEVKVPMVTQEPQQIYENAKAAVSGAVQPTISKVCSAKTYGENKASSLKELSWNKANEVLASQYGQMAVMGLDSTSALAERLLDYYFPATEEDESYGDTPISATDDPVLHTVQTVGRLSNKAARRVYRNISSQIKTIKPQDVKEYVASLIAVLQLTQYLQQINQKVHGITPAPVSSQNEATSNSNDANQNDAAESVEKKS